MATTTTTTQRNPKDSIKSTWRLDPNKDGWTMAHHFFGILDIHQSDLNIPVPVHQKSEPVPYLPNWQMNTFVIFWGALPLIGHQVLHNLTGWNMHIAVAYAYYGIAISAFGIHELRMLRPVLILLSYRSNLAPNSMNLYLLPLQAALYPIVTDFWFYWYHRLMHDVPFLWKFHRTHHLTKHPNALLSIFADTEQEIFDIAVIPFLAFFTMKVIGLELGFYSFWMCHMYVWFTELLGHSGLRIHLYAASPISGLLSKLGMELALEDHDLHHRTGWKSSHNYGKQSRVWDTVFGTCTGRIECSEQNVNYNDIASFPLF
ncbi:hypothetical protein LLEC1_03415 [Akanthomyces lecanii]|uniref:Fatty acid hydroxylase domain-containing protein n=1 Tax=Cordyceps confragosa TaxID=2714763 RepID=A0A179I620_CORDF|nr:hypothetical protein LLEC1_03415 [Akanthomyces lecanii]